LDAPDEAISLLQRALVIYQYALGSQELSVGSTCFYLARLLHKKGRFDEAESLYRRYLDGRLDDVGAVADEQLIGRHIHTSLRQRRVSLMEVPDVDAQTSGP
jgi:tetratricopeptide (TPR) repeat protein